MAGSAVKGRGGRRRAPGGTELRAAPSGPVPAVRVWPGSAGSAPVPAGPAGTVRSALSSPGDSGFVLREAAGLAHKPVFIKLSVQMLDSFVLEYENFIL